VIHARALARNDGHTVSLSAKHKIRRPAVTSASPQRELVALSLLLCGR
jgi:hypothetical protein